MAQNIQLSVIKDTGENIIVTVYNSETFADFQSRVFQENCLFVAIDDFRSLDENLSLDDNFFQCLRNHLNDEDLLNTDSPLFEINLFKQNTQFVLEENIFKENSIEDLTFERLINENVSPNYLDIESQLKEIHNYSEESADNCCRLCANNLDTIKIMIFNSDNCYDEQINNCLPIKVNQSDGLPQYMCDKCAITLSNFHEFTRSVVEADQVLKLKFSNINDFKMKSNEVEEEYLEVCNEVEEEYLEVSNEVEEEYLKVSNEVEEEYMEVSNEVDEEYLEVEEIEEVSNTQSHYCRICDLIIDNLKDALSHSAEVHRINNLFACVFCEYGFETKILLSQHIQTEHKDFNKFICKVCGTRFAYQGMLQRHVCETNKKFQNIKIEYPCGFCNKLFTSKHTLMLHQKTHDCKCETCGKIFASRQTLKEHAVLHADTKSCQCHICGKYLKRLSRLKKHLLTHESSDLIMKEINCCVDCKEGFENESKAVAHQNVGHTIAVANLDKVYRCEFCERCFINIEGLKSHRDVHKNLNPYVCHICSAQFPTYASCTSHKTSHGLFKEGGDKQIFPVIKFFLCDTCDKTHLYWSHLTTHKKLKHNLSNKTFECLDCNLEFPNNYGLTYHRKTKHTEDPIKCSECGENLANYEAWKEHRLALHVNKKYNYQCVKCNYIFHTQKTLEDHLKIHSDSKENKCPYCPLSFVNLSSHLKMHRIKKSHISPNAAKSSDTTNLRPYNCEDCGLTFRNQFTLKNHKMKHCIKLGKSKFVLMVDEEESTPQEIVEVSNNEINEEYIDLGDGNYFKIQSGNTVNIKGKDYFLAEENETIDLNQDLNINFEDNLMQVDDFSHNGITFINE